jgi:DNA polymerase-3 subunit gamma/tau
LVEATEAEASSLAEHAKLVTTDALTRIMEVLTDAEAKLRDVASKKIFMEVTLLKAIEARQAISIDTVIKQLQELRGGGLPAAKEAGVDARPPITAAAAKPAKSAMSIEIPQAPQVLQQLWPALVDATASRLSLGFLAHGQPVSLEKQTLTIQFPAEDEGQVHLVDADALKFLQGKLAELGQPNTQIKFVVAQAQTAIVPAAPIPLAVAAPLPEPKKEKPVPQKLTPDDFKNDPLIQKALEIFKGHIVEVRAGI